MSHSLLLDISQIPDLLAGRAAITRGIAAAMLLFIVPFTVMEMNVRSLKMREYPSYSGFVSRILVVLICLLAYKRLYYFILKTAQLMSFAVLSEEDWGIFLAQNLAPNTGDLSPFSVMLHSFTSVQGILLLILSLVTITIRNVITFIQACFLGVLYVFGPIAIVCGINQKSAQVTRGWVANTFQVAFWLFFLRLTVSVWLTLQPLVRAAGSGMFDDYLGVLSVDVAFLVMVLGTAILSARLLSGENIAAFGEAALVAVQTVAVANNLKAGKFMNREVEKYLKSSPAEKQSLFHHPIPATMTRAYEKFFGALNQAQDGRQKK